MHYNDCLRSLINSKKNSVSFTDQQLISVKQSIMDARDPQLSITGFLKIFEYLPKQCGQLMLNNDKFRAFLRENIKLEQINLARQQSLPIFMVITQRLEPKEVVGFLQKRKVLLQEMGYWPNIIGCFSEQKYDVSELVELAQMDKDLIVGLCVKNDSVLQKIRNEDLEIKRPDLFNQLTETVYLMRRTHLFLERHFDDSETYHSKILQEIGRYFLKNHYFIGDVSLQLEYAPTFYQTMGRLFIDRSRGKEVQIPVGVVRLLQRNEFIEDSLINESGKCLLSSAGLFGTNLQTNKHIIEDLMQCLPKLSKGVIGMDQAIAQLIGLAYGLNFVLNNLVEARPPQPTNFKSITDLAQQVRQLFIELDQINTKLINRSSPTFSGT